MRTLKVVEIKKENGIHQLTLDEAERMVLAAMKQSFMIVVDGEFVKGTSELRRILETANEVYIVPPFAGG